MPFAAGPRGLVCAVRTGSVLGIKRKPTRSAERERADAEKTNVDETEREISTSLRRWSVFALFCE